jgi:hypothetical protein
MLIIQMSKLLMYVYHSLKTIMHHTKMVYKNTKSARLRRYRDVYNEIQKKTEKPNAIRSCRNEDKETSHKLHKSRESSKEKPHKERESSKPKDRESIKEKHHKSHIEKSPVKDKESRKEKSPVKPKTVRKEKRQTEEDITKQLMKEKRPMNEYQKFFQNESKKDKYKTLPPKKRMQIIGDMWRQQKE